MGPGINIIELFSFHYSRFGKYKLVRLYTDLSNIWDNT